MAPKMLISLQAGLAAYFLGLEREKFTWDPQGPPTQGREFCQKLKSHITDLAYRRYPMEKVLQSLKPGQELPFPLPPDVPVAYNGARGPQKSQYISFLSDFRWYSIGMLTLK